MSEDSDTAIAPTTAGGSGDSTYRVRHTGPETLSTTLAVAISDCVGIDPMEFQLYTYIDPDSLDALFDPLRNAAEGRRGWIELHVLGHNVLVYSTGEIEITTQEPTVPDGST